VEASRGGNGGERRGVVAMKRAVPGAESGANRIFPINHTLRG